MKTPVNVSSISILHQFFGLKKPSNPLISVFNFDEMKLEKQTILNTIMTDFYVVALKKDCAGGKCKYGQQYYDFDEGMMYFVAPNQVLQFENVLLNDVKGFVMVVHPDFLQTYPLASKIKDYGYFSYTANEALFLSEKEEKSILDIITNMNREIEANIDGFTQDLLVANLELLLKYCDRFYNRQFLTRKITNNHLLSKLETILNDYFKNEQLLQDGIPSVKFIAAKLNLSPNYLSDMLRVQTGQTTQQHIQNKIIEKAKEFLSTTNMSVSEVAYQLGFEHPQSFHRLFKKYSSVSPLEYRASFN
ncbi:helix-turn-helix transcriptional regulator [Empedobacter brevis]|uniref:helix-turn-helix domain-containing protein n=1 Tax=Empedobacter brevis TaxID=247 RepID=UPI002FE359C0